MWIERALVEYTCPEHGVIKRTVRLDADGKPPAAFYCDVHLCGTPCGFDMCTCDQRASLATEAQEKR